MANHFPDAREAMLWQRVGSLAWILGAKKTDNPFRKYHCILDPEQARLGTWSHKLRSWDRGWESAAARARPLRSPMRVYLPQGSWSRYLAGRWQPT
jgi:hypothetical protein